MSENIKQAVSNLIDIKQYSYFPTEFDVKGSALGAMEVLQLSQSHLSSFIQTLVASQQSSQQYRNINSVSQAVANLAGIQISMGRVAAMGTHSTASPADYDHLNAVPQELKAISQLFRTISTHLTANNMNDIAERMSASSTMLQKLANDFSKEVGPRLRGGQSRGGA